MKRHPYHIRSVLVWLDDAAASRGSQERFMESVRKRGAQASRMEAEDAPAALAERHGTPPFHCLVMVDTDEKAQMVGEAGMKCVGIGEGGGPAEAPSHAESLEAVDIEALLDSARPYRPSPNPWRLDEGEFRPSRTAYWESMFAVTNGVVGVRGAVEEEGGGSYPATFLNGIVGYYPYHYMWAFPGYPERGHAMLNVCEWTGMRIEIDGELLGSGCRGESIRHRWLDLKTGILHRESVWKTRGGVEVRMRTRRLASMTRRHVALSLCEIEADRECRCVLVSPTRFSPHSRHYGGRGVEVLEIIDGGGDGMARATTRSTTSGQVVAAGVRHRVSGVTSKTRLDCGEEAVDFTVEATLDTGQSLQFDKSLVLYCSMDGESPGEDLEAEMAELPDGESLVVEQQGYWAGFWEFADVRLEGDPLVQLGLRLSIFHNRQSIPEDGLRSVGANGLTGDNYAGHVFWDTEQYIAVPLHYTEPESGRGLLEYRHRILDEARKRARLMDAPGAEYSWNSITGEECGHVFEAAQGQIHLQSDIAWAIARYVDATGDRQFLESMGAEIVFETARYLFDRGAYAGGRNGRFVFNAICGPNEYGCGVDNNAYTNYLAQWHFGYAATLWEDLEGRAPGRLARLAEALGLHRAEVDSWRRAAEAMHLPFDPSLGIVPQDDQFVNRDPVDMSKVPFHTDMRVTTHPLNLWRKQWIKQADVVLLMFLMRHRFTDETVERTYRYHEPKTNHGSSLSACMHAIVAADVGDLDDAWHFFRESALMDINDLKGNTGGGMHSACLAGTWMAAVHGLGGMRDGPDGLMFSPLLPDPLTELEFQVVWRGTRIGVRVERAGVVYSHHGGPAVTFRHNGEEISLDGTAPTRHLPT